MPTAVFFVSTTVFVLAVGARIALTRHARATAPFSPSLSVALVGAILVIGGVTLATQRPSKDFVAMSAAAIACAAGTDLFRQWRLVRTEANPGARAPGPPP